MLPDKTKRDDMLKKLEDIDFSEEVLKAYSDDLRSEIKLSKEQRNKLSTKLKNLKTGSFAEIPLVCMGKDCPYAKVCPLVQQEISPGQLDSESSERCPIEIAAARTWTMAWVEALEVDTSDFSEIYMIREMVEAEIMQMRTNKSIALEGFVKEIVVRVDPINPEDKTINYDVSVPLEVKMRFKNLIYKILDKFIATREAKLKWKLKTEGAVTDRMAQLTKAVKNGEITLEELLSAVNKGR